MWLNPLERRTFLRRGEGSEGAWEMPGVLRGSVTGKSLQIGAEAYFSSSVTFVVFQSSFTNNKAVIGILNLILVSIFLSLIHFFLYALNFSNV